ncbi:Protein PPP5D1, partial [Plecturocebus cupreus]
MTMSSFASPLPSSMNNTGLAAQQLSINDLAQAHYSRSAGLNTWPNAQQQQHHLAGPDFALSLRLEYHAVITGHCSTDFLGSSDPPSSSSQLLIAITTGMHHHSQLSLHFFIETESCYVVQAVDFKRMKNTVIKKNKIMCFAAAQMQLEAIILSESAQAQKTNCRMFSLGLTLSSKLEYSSSILAHCNLHLLGSSNPPTSDRHGLLVYSHLTTH